MNKDDKVSQVQLEFELNKKLAHIKGLWSIGGLILVAAIGYFLAPWYARQFKTQEIAMQFAQQSSLQRKSLYYEKRFQAYRELDSLYLSTHNIFEAALGSYQRHRDSASAVNALLALTNASSAFIDRVQVNRLFTDSLYYKQLNRRARLYGALIGVHPNDWPQFEEFLTSLRFDMLALEDREVAAIIDPSRRIDSARIFLLPTFVGRSTNPGQNLDSYNAWLFNNLLSWQQWQISSLADTVSEIEEVGTKK